MAIMDCSAAQYRLKKHIITVCKTFAVVLLKRENKTKCWSNFLNENQSEKKTTQIPHTTQHKDQPNPCQLK